MRDEQTTTLKYNFLFPFKDFPHQNTTSFSLSVQYNMTKRLSRTTLHILTINIVIYNKYIRKRFGVTSAFFFNLHNVVLISGCNTYEIQGDNDFEITCPIFCKHWCNVACAEGNWRVT